MGQLLIHTLQVGLEKLSSCNLAAKTHPNPVKSTDIGAWKLLDIIHKRRWETPTGRHFITVEAQDLLWLFSSKARRGVTQSHQAVPYLARDQTLGSVL